MKKLALMTLFMTTTFSLAPLMAANVAQQEIHLAELNQETLEGFSQGNLSNHILKCSEGDCLPLTMIFKGELLALESPAEAPLYLKFLKTCYIRCPEKERFLFSTDLHEWREFFEFATGRLGISVKAQQEGTIAELELELNERKPL